MLVANLTITVDDELLERARIRALERGTSVNAVLGEYLRIFAGDAEAQTRATATLLALSDENTRVGGPARAKARGRRRWTRGDLHER
jgi:hypothetical protein